LISEQADEPRVVFDSEREVPPQFRREWEMFDQRSDREILIAALFEYALTFPNRVSALDLPLLWQKVGVGDLDTSQAVQLSLIFPDKLKQLQALVHKIPVDRLTDYTKYMQLGERAEFWAYVQVFLPDEAGKHIKDMKEAWQNLKRIAELEKRDGHLLLAARAWAGARLAWPSKFQDLRVGGADLENIANEVRRALARWEPGSFPLGPVLPLGDLSVLLAEEVKLEPGVGIQVVQRRQRGLGASKPLPDRPQM
jgi:hypothetical protein